MTFNRILILAAILAAAGISFATMVANQGVEHRYGYAVFGGSGPDQLQAISYVSLNSGATESIEHSTTATAAHAQFIVVGRDIYFDANQDSQPDSSERFKTRGNTFEVKSIDGRSLYRLNRASLGMNPAQVSDDIPQFVMLYVDVLDPDRPEIVMFQQSGKINVYPELANQGWAHFDGPMAIEFIDDGQKLSASGGPTIELRLAIATPAVECRVDGEDKTVRSNPTSTLPAMIVPTATIKFPAASGGEITKRYDLDQFC